MSRENIKWFGFNLTQKQSVQIFILSIVGIVLSSFLLITFLYPLFMNFIYMSSDPYYYEDVYYLGMIFSMFPYMLVFIIIFILSIYSLNRCRKIAKFYSPMINLETGMNSNPNQNQQYIPEMKPRAYAQFCPNCGKVKKGHERFCTNCGYQIG